LDVLLVAAADLDLVAVTLAGDESRRRTRHLDYGVVGRGGAMDDQLGAPEELLECALLPLGELAQAAEHALGLVARRRRMLVQDEAAVPDQDEVGEGPADVDADAVGRLRHARWLHRNRAERQGTRPSADRCAARSWSPAGRRRPPSGPADDGTRRR